MTMNGSMALRRDGPVGLWVTAWCLATVLLLPDLPA
jgi:hypothetical protein